MKIIKLIHTEKGWLARFISDIKIIKLFGVDTLPTAFTKNANPIEVLQNIKSLNPEYTVTFE